MKIEAYFPTLKRPAAAGRLTHSLDASQLPEAIELQIVAGVQLQPHPLPWIINQHLARTDADVVVVLADHLTVTPHTLARAVDSLQDHFWDLDGMIGLRIENPVGAHSPAKETCFMAMGAPFLDRFPERRVFCPDYWHFHADTELGEYARAIGKFHYEERASVFSYHVNAGLAPMDETYNASRQHKALDAERRKARQANGWTWGLTFDMLPDPASWMEPHYGY